MREPSVAAAYWWGLMVGSLAYLVLRLTGVL